LRIVDVKRLLKLTKLKMIIIKLTNYDKMRY